MAILSAAQLLVNSIDDSNRTRPAICSLAYGGFGAVWINSSKDPAVPPSSRCV
jgi:hypothetical protein